MKRHLTALLAVGLVSIGCTVREEIEKFKADIREELELTRQAFDKAVQAVPGERYVRLLEACRSVEDDIREDCRKRVKALFGVDLETDYEIVVNFGYADESKPLHVDVFQGLTNVAREVQQVADNNHLNLTAVANTMRVATPESVRADVRQKLVEALEAEWGPVPAFPSYGSGSKFGAHGYLRALSADSLPEPYSWGRASGRLTESFPYLHYGWRLAHEVPAPQYQLVMPRLPSGPAPFAKARYQEKITQVAGLLAQSLEAHYTDKAIPLGKRVLPEKWVPARGPFLFVVISEEDWQAHGGEITVTAQVHAEGKPDAPLDSPRAWKYELEQFRSHKTVTAKDEGHEVRWAVKNVGGQMITTEGLAGLAEVQEILQKLAELRDKNPI